MGQAEHLRQGGDLLDLIYEIIDERIGDALEVFATDYGIVQIVPLSKSDDQPWKPGDRGELPSQAMVPATDGTLADIERKLAAAQVSKGEPIVSRSHGGVGPGPKQRRMT